MTVFLGESGRVVLRREQTDQAWFTVINQADIRAEYKRFSVDFAHEQFITGDYVEIKTTDGSDITWIDDPDADNSITRFVHVNAAGNMRLYKTFSDAIEADLDVAIPLKTPAEPQEVSLRVARGQDGRCLAEITSYSITTSRDTIDTTQLGDHYKRQYESGLIGGQGQIECFWATPTECGNCDDGGFEFSSYLAQLCIRLVQGAAFHGLFYVYADDDNEVRSVWYESETCIVTNVAVTISPTQLIQTTCSILRKIPAVLFN